MSKLVEEFLELQALMEKAEQDRLWDHFLKTGQVLPSTKEIMKQINEHQQILDQIPKFPTC